MKFRNSVIGGSGRDRSNVARVLCEGVNDVARRQAADAYLKGEAHAAAIVADVFRRACQGEIARVRKGKPSAHAPFMCCSGCFENLLSQEMFVTFAALVTTLDSQDERWDAVPVTDAPDEADTEAMSEFLQREAYAEYETSYSLVSEDVAARDAYVETFAKLLRISARLAKTLGEEEGARDFLDALGLLEPLELPEESRVVDLPGKGLVSRETATEIYAVATRGWRRLLTAVGYAALEPLPLRRKSARKA